MRTPVRLSTYYRIQIASSISMTLQSLLIASIVTLLASDTASTTLKHGCQHNQGTARPKVLFNTQDINVVTKATTRAEYPNNHTNTLQKKKKPASLYINREHIEDCFHQFHGNRMNIGQTRKLRFNFKKFCCIAVPLRHHTFQTIFSYFGYCGTEKRRLQTSTVLYP